MVAPPVLSLVVAAGLMSGVLETLPAPCVMLASGDWVAAVVEVAAPMPALVLVLPEAPELPILSDGVVAELLLEMPLVALPAAPPMFVFCAIAWLPRSAAATTREVLSMTLTSSFRNNHNALTISAGPGTFPTWVGFPAFGLSPGAPTAAELEG